jgi:putative membrane protein
MHTAAIVLVLLVAAIHCYIVVLEMFLWATPRGQAAFGMTADFAAQTKTLAANQGLYNGFLAAGLIVGVILRGDPGFALQVFILSCVIVAGIYGAVTASRRIIFVQTLPAAVALLFTLLGR